MYEVATAGVLSDHNDVTNGIFPVPTPAKPIPATLTASVALVKVTAVPPSIDKAVLQIEEVVGAGTTYKVVGAEVGAAEGAKVGDLVGE